MQVKINVVNTRPLFIRRMWSIGHWMPVNKLPLFNTPSTIWPSGAHLPEGKRSIMHLKTKQRHISLYFTLSMMYNSVSQQLRGRFDKRQGALERMIRVVPAPNENLISLFTC